MITLLTVVPSSSPSSALHELRAEARLDEHELRLVVRPRRRPTLTPGSVAEPRDDGSVDPERLDLDHRAVADALLQLGRRALRDEAPAAITATRRQSSSASYM